jgi:rhodanese-related sulfurtransferase
VVSRERVGSQVRYELAGDEVLRLWLALRDTSAEQLAEVERSAREYLGEEVEAIDRNELIARMRRGKIELVDVRPPEEFAAGHIDGARSIPLNELEQHLADLPDDREVIAYCRGPHCVMAQDAVHRMQAAGLTARKLEEGWPEWRLAKSTPTPSVAG